MAHSPFRLILLVALSASGPGCARPADSEARSALPPAAAQAASPGTTAPESAARSLLMAAEPTRREEDWRVLGGRVLAVLERLARDPAEDSTTRSRALAALGASSHPEGCAVLERLTVDGQLSPSLRAAATVALGRCGGTGAFPTLRALLRDRDRQVREATARALGSVASQEARIALEEALAREEDAALREAFQHQLARMHL